MGKARVREREGTALKGCGRTQRRNRGWHPPELRLLGSKARKQIHDRTDEECIRITRQTVGDVMRGIIADAGKTMEGEENSEQRPERCPHEQREDVGD